MIDKDNSIIIKIKQPNRIEWEEGIEWRLKLKGNFQLENLVTFGVTRGGGVGVNTKSCKKENHHLWNVD